MPRASRAPVRRMIAVRAGLDRLMRVLTQQPRQRPELPERILIAHELLLGDTIMLTPLLSALRNRYPAAQIDMMMSPAFLPLYQGKPYGVNPIIYDARQPDTARVLLDRKGYDLVFIPAENRLGLLARALRAKWIVGFENDQPVYKNTWLDELYPFGNESSAWCDLIAHMAWPMDAKPPQLKFSKLDWPAPAYTEFNQPDYPYAVLHVGASSPLKYWSAANWRAVIKFLQHQKIGIVLTCGKAEHQLVEEIDPDHQFQHYAGTLDLAQMWHLLRGAELVLSLDTGIAHVARTTCVPLIVLFGGASAKTFGGGEFFYSAKERKISIPDFPCRNQNIIFRRPVIWSHNCAVSPVVCSDPKCMNQLPVAQVLQAVTEVLA